MKISQTDFFLSYLQPLREVAEWSKAHAWKVCMLQKGIEGSNPFLSAVKCASKEAHFFYPTPWKGCQALPEGWGKKIKPHRGAFYKLLSHQGSPQVIPPYSHNTQLTKNNKRTKILSPGSPQVIPSLHQVGQKQHTNKNSSHKRSPHLIPPYFHNTNCHRRYSLPYVTKPNGQLIIKF